MVSMGGKHAPERCGMYVWRPEKEMDCVVKRYTSNKHYHCRQSVENSTTTIYWILTALMKCGKTMLPVLILDMIALQYVVLQVVMMEMKETKSFREISPFMRDRIL